MDSKYPTYESDDGPAPPSYIDALSSASPSASKIPEALTSSFTSHGSTIQSQLNHLSTQFSALQTQKAVLAHAQEEKILSLLTAHIAAYLSDFANTGLKKGTVVLVPAQCVQDKKAHCLEFDQEDKPSYNLWVEVGDKESLNGGTWFWEDEEMAKRLARALTPHPELPARPDLTQKTSKNVVVSQGGNKSRFWSRKSSSKKVESLIDAKPKDSVSMEIMVHEVAFESENAFGLLETQRGYSIIMYFKIY